MLTLYPSNSLELLAELLASLLLAQQREAAAAEPLALLKPAQVLVESQGMEHWLRLQLAERHGIAMNLEFPMPSRFIWELARQLLGEAVPQQSPYSRELLCWRLDALLADSRFASDGRAAEANSYWGHGSAAADPLKRFQLAGKLADLFEQYLLFRPDWLEEWQQQPSSCHWQGLLWNLLLADEPRQPLLLQRQALARLEQLAATAPERLPSQVVIFAINAMAPPTLQFFEALAALVPVHLFHLNPCVEFWGDQLSDRARARAARSAQLDGWLAQEPGNPLLANLGTQGREFFNALQAVGGYEVSAFVDEQPQSRAHTKPAASLLQRLQRDILTLHDGRTTPTPLQDESLVISSSHSALREIQALHDHLRHAFAADETLTPRDVLVMCPAIEDYAPYIDAVFRRPWDADEERLPCSIADRSQRDGEPLVAAFAELLQLPDSRFAVSTIIDYLRLPAVQRRLAIRDGELAQIEHWLKLAAVHWGLDGDHRQQQAALAAPQPMFSWQWGLERLLLGLAHGDRTGLVSRPGGELLLLPEVEGQGAVVLGRLLQLLERLRRHLAALRQPRSADGWQRYLHELFDSLFVADEADDSGREAVLAAIDGLQAQTAAVGYQAELPLSVVRCYLNHHFSQPAGRNQFLTGQITFCSMVPMRSIPFRIIAILGLNDGAFPRQSTPLGFDLMAQQPRRAGDRSRRGDDRYLFLEALISARQQLYLSYQGRDIRTNNARQPSLLLKELFDYLQRGYGWQFDGPASAIRQQPLHPFSRANFTGPLPGFDAGWARLVAPLAARNNRIELPPLPASDQALTLEQLQRFYANPLKSFARERLGLLLDEPAPLASDDEPFAVDGLTRYQLREQLCQAWLGQGEAPERVSRRFAASGLLPASPVTPALLERELAECQQLAAAVAAAGGQQLAPRKVQLLLAGEQLQAELPLLADGHSLLLWRPGSWRAADQLRLWLYHLLANGALGGEISSRALYRGEKDGELLLGMVQLPPLAASAAQALLAPWLAWRQRGLCQPLLLHAELGRALLGSGKTAQREPEQLLSDDDQQRLWLQALAPAYGDSRLVDEYFCWFWDELPPLTTAIHQPLLELYLPLYRQLLSGEKP